MWFFLRWAGIVFGYHFPCHIVYYSHNGYLNPLRLQYSEFPRIHSRTKQWLHKCIFMIKCISGSDLSLIVKRVSCCRFSSINSVQVQNHVQLCSRSILCLSSPRVLREFLVFLSIMIVPNNSEGFGARARYRGELHSGNSMELKISRLDMCQGIT